MQASVHKRSFTADGLGICFQYDSDWYVDESGKDRSELSVLYDTKVKATIYLLDSQIDFDNANEETFSNLMKRACASYFQPQPAVIKEIFDFKSMELQDGKSIQMSATMEVTESTPTLRQSTLFYTLYFIRFSSGITLFAKYEEYVDNTSFRNEMDEIVRSIKVCGLPLAIEFAHSVDSVVFNDYSDFDFFS